MTITKKCTRCNNWIEIKTTSGLRHVININNISRVIEPSSGGKICFIYINDNYNNDFITADITYNEFRDILMGE